ncbi:MAG: CDP-alcohol phosphatidyltransferase family protein [Candidatus Hodarchaeota archaeon]
MKENSINKRFLIPQIITALRIVLIPPVLIFFFNDQIIESFLLFTISWITDIIDGICARKLEVTSTFGAYFDATTDFIFIFISFFAFVLKEIYPFWILIIIGFMFLQFILTSRQKKPVYDPIGRYSGLFLYVIIGITLVISDNFVYTILLIVMLVFFVLSLISRYIALRSSKQ